MELKDRQEKTDSLAYQVPPEQMVFKVCRVILVPMGPQVYRAFRDRKVAMER